MALALLLGLLAAAPAARPFADERVLLDRRLETLRRILPDGPTAAADVLVVRDVAEAAHLARVEVQARVPFESGARGEQALELQALGDYKQVDRFYQRIALSHRLVDVESMTLTATGEDQIQLSTVLRFPFWPRARRCRRRPSRAAGGRPGSRSRRSTHTSATSRWRSPSRMRSPRGGAPGATRGSSCRSCRPSSASGRWSWATPRSARTSRSAAWRSAKVPCARSRAGSSAASCA